MVDTQYSQKCLNKFNNDGTFYHLLPVGVKLDKGDVYEKNFKKFKIKPLNDEELMEGYRLVLPKVLDVKVHSSDDKNRYKKVKSFHYFQINLCQLPYHLMDKIVPVYNENGNLTNYYASDKIYKYRIIPSDIDDKIIKLAKIVMSKNYLELKRVKKYISEIEVLNLNGWVLKSAKKFVSD